MIRYSVLLFLMLVSCVDANGASNRAYEKIDTLERHSDTLFARISSYRDDGSVWLVEEGILIPDTLLESSFVTIRILNPIFLPRLRRRKVFGSRVIRHGQLSVFEADGRKSVHLFNFGKKLKSEYRNSDNRLVAMDEYYHCAPFVIDGAWIEDIGDSYRPYGKTNK